MGSDIVNNGQSKPITEIPVKRANRNALQLPDDKVVVWASNGKGIKFGHINPDRSEDVDIEKCKTPGDIGLTEVMDGDTTEGSSSFDDTFSGDESESAISDAEAESLFPSFDFDFDFNFNPSISSGPGDIEMTMRKRDLTHEWRKFVRPLRWRCKWAELRVHWLMSQRSKFHKKLDKLSTDVSSINPLPVSGETIREVRRKKRKKVEDELNTTSYVSQHPLFSYFGKNNSVAGWSPLVEFGPSEKIVNGNAGFNLDDGWSNIKITGNDNTPERVLWKIEVAKSRLSDLRARINKLESDYFLQFAADVVKPRDSSTTSHKKIASPKSCDRKRARSTQTSARINNCPTGNSIKSEASVPCPQNASSHQSTFEEERQFHIGSSNETTEIDTPSDGQIAELFRTNSWYGGVPSAERAMSSRANKVPTRQRMKRRKRTIYTFYDSMLQ